MSTLIYLWGILSFHANFDRWSKCTGCAQWVAKDPVLLQADSEDSDQTGSDLCPALVFLSVCTVALFYFKVHVQCTL